MFRITTTQFGYTMYASACGWSDNPSDAYTYDERDSASTKLTYWRAVADNNGFDPALVKVSPCKF